MKPPDNDRPGLWRFLLIPHSAFRIPHSTIHVLAFAMLLFVGCARPPIQSIEAATRAVERAKIEADGRAPCRELVLSAEGFLQKARLAMEKKNYEDAKTEAFEALRRAYDAHLCGGASMEPPPPPPPPPAP